MKRLKYQQKNGKVDLGYCFRVGPNVGVEWVKDIFGSQLRDGSALFLLNLAHEFSAANNSRYSEEVVILGLDIHVLR